MIAAILASGYIPGREFHELAMAPRHATAMPTIPAVRWASSRPRRRRGANYRCWAHQKKCHLAAAFFRCAEGATCSGLLGSGGSGSGGGVSSALDGIGSALGGVHGTGSSGSSASGSGGSARSGFSHCRSRSSGGSRCRSSHRGFFLATCGQSGGSDHSCQNERLVHLDDYLRVLDEEFSENIATSKGNDQGENCISICT